MEEKEAQDKAKSDEENMFRMKDLNLREPHGQLLAIDGTVGSGKTSPLQGIIGEMRQTGDCMDDELKETVDGMPESLSVFSDKVRVAREMGTEGRLSRQAGVMNLTLRVGTIAVATAAVARGNLTQKIVRVWRDAEPGEVGNVQGIWQDITLSTTQVRGFAQISEAAMDDYPVEASGDLLGDNFQKNTVVREAAELANRSTSEFLANILEISVRACCSSTAWPFAAAHHRQHLDVLKIEAGRMMMKTVSYSLRQTVFGVLKTLIVRDHLVGPKLAFKVLKKYGHTAKNGSLAVDAFKERVIQAKSFDIIAMDVFMPFMGSMDATELIRAYKMHRGLAPTPIIALTVHIMIDDRERCLQAGMDKHITIREPLRRGDLLNALDKLAGKRGVAKHLLLRWPPTMYQSFFFITTFPTMNLTSASAAPPASCTRISTFELLTCTYHSLRRISYPHLPSFVFALHPPLAS
ncbi:hypothetical protein D9615_010385 [Tricholomella constricta]|uniref:Response regulatory domain-containing protein n=1 Tax=Tricholomella constricta TaxID=117010 RepID=A0A8H5LSV7_9AGAR|nr:hypothetical protein D9615_010384 [Tricholomella constricta]KAF5368258.1 hypothetical protein D9615_010385 [Tricholomella constricta]